MPDSPAQFRTDNLFVASFLMAKGVRFIHAEPMSDGRYVYFLFEDEGDGKVATYEQEYLNNEAVPVGAFVNSLNTLKGVIRKHTRSSR